MYIQSSSAPDVVRGCDKSPGREPSRAERRNGVTKRTRHLENTQKEKKKKNAESQTVFVCLCVRRVNVQPLLCPLSYCADLNSRTPLQFKTKIIRKAKNNRPTADIADILHVSKRIKQSLRHSLLKMHFGPLSVTDGD